MTRPRCDRTEQPKDIRRGEIWWVTVHGARPEDPRESRPAVVLSSDYYCSNHKADTLLVNPLTRRKGKPRFDEVPIRHAALSDHSYLMTAAIQPLKRWRFKHRIGSVPQPTMAEIEGCLLQQLGIEAAGRA